jgi:hypothetical protein
MTPQEIFNEMPKNLNADAAKGHELGDPVQPFR